MHKETNKMSEQEYFDQVRELRVRAVYTAKKEQEALSRIFGILNGSRYRYLAKCVIMFEKAMAELAECFDFCLGQRLNFVIQVLNRSFIETLFRYLYITLDFLKTSDEREAYEYTEILSVSETYTMTMKLKSVLKKIGRLEKDVDPFDVVSEKKITKEEMRDVSSRYSFANIMLRLNDYYEAYSSDESTSPLIGYVIKYSLQSSFMHGGPSAQLRHLFEQDNYTGIVDNYKFILNSMQLVHIYMYYCAKKIDDEADDEEIRIELDPIE